MNLSSHSWHYLLYRYLRNFFEDGAIPFWKTSERVNYVPKSLCSYFWLTVLMSALLPLAVSFLIVIGTIVLVLSPIWWPLSRRWHRIEGEWDLYKYGKGPRPNRTFWGRKALDEPQERQHLLLQWLKARKAKYCPLITLVED